MSDKTSKIMGKLSSLALGVITSNLKERVDLDYTQKMDAVRGALWLSLYESYMPTVMCGVDLRGIYDEIDASSMMVKLDLMNATRSAHANVVNINDKSKRTTH